MLMLCVLNKYQSIYTYQLCSYAVTNACKNKLFDWSVLLLHGQCRCSTGLNSPAGICFQVYASVSIACNRRRPTHSQRFGMPLKLTRASARSGAAKFPAHRSAPFTWTPAHWSVPVQTTYRSAPIKSVYGPLRSVFRSTHMLWTLQTVVRLYDTTPWSVVCGRPKLSAYRDWRQ